LQRHARLGHLFGKRSVGKKLGTAAMDCDTKYIAETYDWLREKR
jgi:hypothetical protein